MVSGGFDGAIFDPAIFDVTLFDVGGGDSSYYYYYLPKKKKPLKKLDGAAEHKNMALKVDWSDDAVQRASLDAAFQRFQRNIPK